jgi:flagellar biosynthesis/type III secretory pathway M-ring protein FliF/YscJ
MLEPMSLADLLRSRDGQGTATSGATATVPRQALHDMAQQHPDRVAQHLLHTWLRPLP